ncbi:hypothetical protein PJWF_00068 [Achromobacter phage JWF]|uniref:hypothetical protein n=1 Tax=Achromobacter phage JWF TaxID=1589748 RepID=UPI000588E3AE|nr:hypothetical protein AXJ13_gp068 [Achromobacter phage JWF]AJD82962.1 hypothetical protein PJWF_00068 [Achromobacter phage JWF]
MRSIRIAIVGAVMGLAACFAGQAQAIDIVQTSTYASLHAYAEPAAAVSSAPASYVDQVLAQAQAAPAIALLLAGLGLLALFLLASAPMRRMARVATAVMQLLWRRDVRPWAKVLMRDKRPGPLKRVAWPTNWHLADPCSPL